MHNDLASDAHFKIYKCKSLASDAHFKIYTCKDLASDAHEPWLPMHKLQNHGDLLLIFFSIFSLIFSLINKRKVYHGYQLQNFQKIHDSDDFGVYRSFCRRSCSLSLTNFFFREDTLVLSYRKGLLSMCHKIRNPTHTTKP
jgi:hypothetical protein